MNRTTTSLRPSIRLCVFVALAALGIALAAGADGSPVAARAPEQHAHHHGGDGAITTQQRLITTVSADIDHIEGDLDATGRLSLQFGEESVTVVLQEVELIGPNARVVYQDLPGGGSVAVGEVTARTFRGQVEGQSGSSASVTIDSANQLLLGMLKLDGQHVDVVTQTLADGTTLVGTSWSLDQSTDLIAPTPPAAGDELSASGIYTARYEYLGANADTAYVNAVGSSWTTYVANQVNAQYDLWDSVSIRFQIEYFRETGTNWGGDCGTNLNSLSNHLVSTGRSTWAEIHQLYSGNELDGLGCSWPGNDFATQWNVGAIESLDFWPFDGYNPQWSTTEFAIVSGHEAGHQNYRGGEPGHPTDRSCETYWFGSCTDYEYNVMCCPVEWGNSEQPDDQGLWWPQSYWSDLQNDAYWRL